MLFQDPNKPIATCISRTCKGCPVRKTVHCHFKPRDLLRFFIIISPTFLLGGAGIYLMNVWLLVLWLIMILVFFGLVEIRVLCSHCPHYAEPGNTLKCWVNYGSPKIWKYHSGPMSRMEKVIMLGGFVLIWGYPLFFLITGRQWFQLILYILSVSVFFMILKIFLCSQCMNFACPLNSVAGEIQRKFSRRNPEVAKSRSVKIKDRS